MFYYYEFIFWKYFTILSVFAEYYKNYTVLIFNIKIPVVYFFPSTEANLKKLKDVTKKQTVPDREVKAKYISDLDNYRVLKAMSAVAITDRIGLYSEIPNFQTYLKYASLVGCCDVEGSFSHYNRIYIDVRRNLDFENFRKYLLIGCNPL